MRGANNHVTPGERVRYYRKRRGLSQQILADRTGRSLSWVEKIESGRMALAAYAAVDALALALDVSRGDLMPDDVADVDRQSHGRSVPALRKLVMSYRFVNPRFYEEDVAPLALPALKAAVADLWSAYQESRYPYVVAQMHRTLPRAYATARIETGRNRNEARIQLAYLYQVSASVLAKIGEVDLAFVCADRGESTLGDLEHPVARTSISRSVAHTLTAHGQYDDAVAVAEQAIAEVRVAPTQPQLISTVGSLHLVAAVAAARSSNRSDARSHLQAAAILAGRLATDANHLFTAFGPTNVEIHTVAVAGELGDFETAAHIGPGVDVSDMPVERQVRHRLEVARALHHRGRRDQALDLVIQAERIAEEQVRRHVLTHGLVSEWVKTAHKRPSRELDGLARRIGVL